MKRILMALLLVTGSVFSSERVIYRPAKKGDIKSYFDHAKKSKNISDRMDALRGLDAVAPSSPGDVEVLSGELTGPMAPTAQELISRSSDPALVPALIKATEENWRKSAPFKGRVLSGLADAARSEEINRRISVGVLVEVLGRHKDRRAIPLLKEMLDDETLSYQVSTALSHMGDDALFSELMGRMGQEKDINLANIKAPRLRRMIEEIDSPGTDKKRRGKIINQIKGSRDPEVNAALKALALHHQNYDVRSQAGVALVNSIVMDPTVGDSGFIIKWASQKSEDIGQEDAKAWSVYAMDKTWTPEYIPTLISLLKSPAWINREHAATCLGRHKVSSAVPYLESVLKNDQEDSVRGASWGALKEITGKEYTIEVYESDFRKGDPTLERLKNGQEPHHRLVGKNRP